MREIHITEKEQGQRTDKFLMKYMSLAPKSFIYKMLRKKNIKLNSNKAQGGELLKAGDILCLYLSDDTIEGFREVKSIKKASGDIDVIYEDENVIFCAKPQGLIVHPDIGHKTDTLNDRLLYYLLKKGEYDPEGSLGFTPSVCNRLDVNTSGIVTMGKNLPAVQQLNRAFRQRLADKYYLAVLRGEMKEGGTVRGYHIKDDNNVARLVSDSGKGSPICTHYRPLEYGGGFTLAEIKLETGKSHQIRLCMSEIGFPVAGDRKYGDKAVNRRLLSEFGITDQLLHSHRLILGLKDGALDYLYGREFTAPPPHNFANVCSYFFEKTY